MDVRLVIKHRLAELGFGQRDLAAAAGVTESYISQLLSQKKAPPSAERTGLYEKINAFLKLPKGKLSAIVETQRREELKKRLADPPAPLFKEVRELVIKKCSSEKQKHIRDIFEKQAFGELERLVTQKLLDVTKRIANDELRNENWLRTLAKLRDQPHAEMRTNILEFLDTDVFNLSADQCATFLDPMIDAWDIDLKTFGMEVVLNRRLASKQLMKFQFLEMESDRSFDEEPGFKEFLGIAAMSGDATDDEMAFLKGLRFKHGRPTALYYYRQLQSLRDPLHFRQSSVAFMHKRRDADDVKKQMHLDLRKKAVQRWAKHKGGPGNKRRRKS